MGKQLDKFLLLMWKNWVLLSRNPIQTVIEIVVPLLCILLLVGFRAKIDVKQIDEVAFQSFCTIPMKSDVTNAICRSEGTFRKGYMDLPRDSMVYSPQNDVLDRVMDMFRLVFAKVIPVKDSNALERYFKHSSTNMTIAAVEFPDSYRTLKSSSDIDNIEVTIRFPGETRINLDSLTNNWQTNLIYPNFQTQGPRQYTLNAGGPPSYQEEGFLAIQHILTLSLVHVRKGSGNSLAEIISWLKKIPVISMRRYPHSQWWEDPVVLVFSNLMGQIVTSGFMYSCTCLVKSITIEKEKQLKESMKIMGLPNWLHWLAWFVRSFIILFVTIVLTVVLLKVKVDSSKKFSVFTYADPSVVIFFLVFYICATITFCFVISVLFSKASTATSLAGIIFLLTYLPFFIMKENHYGLSSTLPASLCVNSALGFGFRIMFMFEGTAEGVQWNNIFSRNNPDDPLTLGLVMIMLALDTFIFLFIALYVEAVFPGEYGVSQPWYFLFTKNFWCGPRNTEIEDIQAESVVTEGKFFEPEPKHLRPGVQIKNLQKVFNGKTAVKDLSLNLYEDQITVLLGHNGAGKTTTMFMLTGMITPTSGTATVNGFDIRTEIGGVRRSLGLCPQHNIIFNDLTVSEHLYFFSKLKGLPKKDIQAEIDKYIGLLRLERKRKVRAGKLSGGMKRKLCVGMALCGNSKVVMLDEPTAGVDPSARRALWDLLQSQKKGRTLLLTTHFMDEADVLGDRIAIMSNGQLQCSGSSFFLKKKYGAGYSLILDKSSECKASEVTSLLRKHIPNIEVHSNVGSELTYLLAEDRSASFEPMLKDLENNSSKLGVRSYGISMTTMEEVFMKVRTGTLEKKDVQSGRGGANRFSTNAGTRINVGAHDSYSGWKLLVNQILAMLMKKFLYIYRSWIMWLIKISIAVFLPIFALVALRNSQTTGDLPAMPLNLNRFGNPITVVANVSKSAYADQYLGMLRDLNYQRELCNNVTDRMLTLTKQMPSTVRSSYIVGASFDDSTNSHITAWFNNDPYHSAGISLSFALNAMLRQTLECDKCSISFTNHPLPYTAGRQVERIDSGESKGSALASIMCVMMTFVAPFYVFFVVKENVSKFKHLQFVSGVNVWVFWCTSWLCDLFTYMVIVIAVIITLLAFQEDGFSTADDIGRMLVIFFYFGWAFLPMLYISGYFFDGPSTGYSNMAALSLLAYMTYLVVEILSSFSLYNISNTLHWVFLVVPHYSLAMGITHCYTFFLYKRICDECINGVCYKSSPLYNKICKGVDESYYRWETPGIGKNLVFSFTEGVVLFLVLLTIEFKPFSKMMYYILQTCFPKRPTDILDEDSDVAEEKLRIRNATRHELLNGYTLVLRDLTKYYKNFLAVNSLCLGIHDYECFGLLGVNGAGKTTTFKMMTGDVRITYGEGWVKGFSLKTQMKRVQKFIGYCPQFDALLEDMTAKETITIFALLRGIRCSDCDGLAEILAREFDFVPHLKKKVKALSGGNKRKLSTAISFIGDPAVIFLDEPTAGLDTVTKRYLWNALCKFRDNGKCIILTTHSMEECEALCTRLAVMVNGHFKCLGSIQHIKSKFAGGYSLTIRLRKSEDGTQQDYDTKSVEKFVRQNFPGAKLREKHQELLEYYVTDTLMPWSRMFGIMERAKRSNLNIDDYSLGQSSLEQVFLSFMKQQQ